MIKVLITTFLLVFLHVPFCVADGGDDDAAIICAQVLTWAQNKKTQKCKLFPTACLPSHYKSIDPIECDCDDLENNTEGVGKFAKQDCLYAKQRQALPPLDGATNIKRP